MVVVQADDLGIAVLPAGTASRTTGDTSGANSVRAVISSSAVVVDIACGVSILFAETVGAGPSGSTIRVGSTDVIVVETDVLRVAVRAGST